MFLTGLGDGVKGRSSWFTSVSSPPQKVDVCGLAQVSGEGGQVGKANTVKNLKHAMLHAGSFVGLQTRSHLAYWNTFLSAVDLLNPEGPPPETQGHLPLPLVPGQNQSLTP